MPSAGYAYDVRYNESGYLGTIKYESGDKAGDKYVGDLVSGKVIYKNSICGNGLDFSLDLPQGGGRLQKNNGDTFEGKFYKGAFQSGHIAFSNGNVFDGDWISGTGVMKYSNGDVYTGAYSSGNPFGKGKLTNSGGTKYTSLDRYDGKFINLKKSGGFEVDNGNGDTSNVFFDDDKLVISSKGTSIEAASKFIDNFRGKSDLFIQEQIIPIIISGLKKEKPEHIATVVEKHFRLFSASQLETIERQHGRDPRLKKALVLVKECREISQAPSNFFKIHLADSSSANVGENWTGPMRAGGSSVLSMKFGVQVESLAKFCTANEVVVKCEFRAYRIDRVIVAPDIQLPAEDDDGHGLATSIDHALPCCL